MENLVFADFSSFFYDYHSYLIFLKVPCNDKREPVSYSYKAMRNKLARPYATIQRNLNHLSLIQNLRKNANVTIYLPSNLRKLKIENSAIHDKKYGSSVVYVSRVMEELYMAGNELEYLRQVPWMIDTLSFIDISSNRCRYISNVFFSGVKGLRHLLLANNYLGPFLASDDSKNVFDDQKGLVHIDLSLNKIRLVNKNLFRYCSNMESIDIHGNQLTGTDFDFRHMIHLRLFNFSNNQIRSLSEDNMEHLDIISRSGNLTIDLTRNRLLCDCSTLKFMKWMRSNLNAFYHHKEYICTFSNNTEKRLVNFDDVVDKLDLECQSKTLIIVLSVTFIIVVLLTIISVIIYRYRWSIRYLFYAAKREYRKYFRKPELELQMINFRYDAFVSYADEDRALVINNFIKEMEEENGLKLCIHNRDFIPGKNVEENISDAIHGSRKTICLLSQSYLASHWCMFEYNMARMESIYFRSGEEVLFLVLLEDFSIEGIPMSMLHMIERKTYLEFSNQNVENPAFWLKIKEVISN